MRPLLIVLLLILLIGAFPVWPYSMGWGYVPSSSLAAMLLVLVIVLLSRRV
jgi:hypothetical protein